MKGISEIITLVLILMIVVALVGLAYIWFSGLFSNLTGATQTSVETTTSSIGTNFKIESARNVTPTIATVTIRNIGNTPLNISRMSAYVSDDYKQIDSAGATIKYVTYGNTSTFNITGLSDPKGKKLKLVAESGLEQITTIA